MTEQTQPAPQAAPQQPPQLSPEQEVILLRGRLEVVCAQRNEAMDRSAILITENAMLHAQLKQVAGEGKAPAPAAPRGRKRLGVQPKG